MSKDTFSMSSNCAVISCNYFSLQCQLGCIRDSNNEYNNCNTKYNTKPLDLWHVQVIQKDNHPFSRHRPINILCPLFHIGLQVSLKVMGGCPTGEVDVEEAVEFLVQISKEAENGGGLAGASVTDENDRSVYRHLWCFEEILKNFAKNN